MMDNSTDFTIFRLSMAPSLNEIIENFRNFPELSAPVVQAQAAPALYAIPAYNDAGFSILPVFTDPGMTKPPCVCKPTQSFLQTLFNAPAAGIFAFNPPPLKPEGAPAAEVRLDKRQLSTVIGALQTAPGRTGADEAAVMDEAGLGNLHRANYLASSLLAGDPSRPRGIYAEILINLGLLQEAYDYIKAFQTPEFFYYRALVLRHSGEPAKAREWLDKVPDGAPCGDKKKVELAWLLLEEGKPDEALAAFRPLEDNSSEKTSARFGAGAALMKKALAGRGPADINDSLSAFRKALTAPSPLAPEIFFCMGNLYFRTGNHAGAGICYRKAAALRPAVQSKANLCLALIRTGEFQEAAALINDIALTDPKSAGRLAAGLPREEAVKLLEASRQHRDTLPTPETRAGAMPSKIVFPSAPPAEQAAPRLQRVEMESLMTAASAAPETRETRGDDITERALKLASGLEKEFNKKIHFNADGLAEVEKKLRLTFTEAGQNPENALETVKDCSAFFCFLLQERYKGRLIKMPELDHWGWPMVFDTPKHMVTYPAQRVWKLLEQEHAPGPGWLAKYLQYIETELRSAHTDKPQGAAAVQNRVPSHPRAGDRRADRTQTHHDINLHPGRNKRHRTGPSGDRKAGSRP